MTFRLRARKGVPFVMAVEAPVGIPAAPGMVLVVTLPDGSAHPDSPFTLVESPTTGTGRYQVLVTFDEIGTHVATCQDNSVPASAVNGVACEVVVIDQVRPISLETYGNDEGPDATGLTLRWPCPAIAGLKCIEAFSQEQIEEWAVMATQTMFSDTCNRFPGTDNFVQLRPLASAGCLCMMQTCRGMRMGLDLWQSVRYPILEITAVTVNGVDIGTDGWWIENERYLIAEAGTSWPMQHMATPSGGADTWSITVRYGRTPPAMVVRARDQLLMANLFGNEVPAVSALCLVNGLVSLSEGGRTMQFNPETSTRLYDEAVKRWKCRKSNQSFIVDPSEMNAVGSSAAHAVSGDAAPFALRVFGGSGCDIAAALAALIGP